MFAAPLGTSPTSLTRDSLLVRQGRSQLTNSNTNNEDESGGGYSSQDLWEEAITEEEEEEEDDDDDEGDENAQGKIGHQQDEDGLDLDLDVGEGVGAAVSGTTAAGGGNQRNWFGRGRGGSSSGRRGSDIGSKTRKDSTSTSVSGGEGNKNRRASSATAASTSTSAVVPASASGVASASASGFTIPGLGIGSTSGLGSATNSHYNPVHFYYERRPSIGGSGNLFQMMGGSGIGDGNGNNEDVAAGGGGESMISESTPLLFDDDRARVGVRSSGAIGGETRAGGDEDDDGGGGGGGSGGGPGPGPGNGHTNGYANGYAGGFDNDSQQGEVDSSWNPAIVLEPERNPQPSENPRRREAGVLIKYSVPICLTHLLEQSLLLTTLITLGHLNVSSLASATLSNLTLNVLCLSVIQGFCAALDTLCPQAFSSKKPDITGLFTLRTGIIVAGLEVGMVVVLANAEAIFLAAGQEPEVARLAGIYLRIMIFGLPGYAGFELTRRWLQAQGLMAGPTVAVLIVCPINIFLNWLLVWGPHRVRIGFIGAPLSLVISLNLMFLFCITYCLIFVRHSPAWRPYSRKEIFNLNGLKLNWWMGLKGTGMVASEWWSWEIVAIATSYLGPTQLAGQSVLLTSASFLYQIAFSVGIASSVRVGNLLGGGQPHLARLAGQMTMLVGAGVAIFNSGIFLIFRNSWGYLFSSDEEVIKIVASVLPLVSLFQVADSLTGCAMGILRGAGKQGIGAVINLASYYVIGLPIGFCLAFLAPKSWTTVHRDLRGLWTGLTVALAYTAILSCWWVWRIDWKKEAERAEKMVEEEDRDRNLRAGDKVSSHDELLAHHQSTDNV